jgi:membrane protein DedA with SNARE-associated domain
MAEWITSIMNFLGYTGIGLLMFLENLFPPIPSELIMPLAGFTISQGKMNFAPAIMAGLFGTMLGALPWYYIGKSVGEKRLKRWADHYGKWLGITSEDIEKSKQWFQRYGYGTVFFCRLVPGIRTLISVPAGFCAMPLFPFLIYSSLGTAIWVSLLTYLGYALGENYTLVDEYLGPVSKIVLMALLVAFGVWLLYKQFKRQ